VAIPPGLVDLLARHIPADAAEDAFVFPSLAGESPVSYFNVAKRGFKKTHKRAGLDGKGITVHDLRHAAASLLIRQGLTPVEVAAHLGHADSGITLRVYAHLFDPTDTAARIRSAFEVVELSD
jgi:integrase